MTTQFASDVVLTAFRKCWLWDATVARPGSVADYQTLFPGFEQVVAAEYERLSSEYPSADDARAAAKARVGPYRLDGFLGRGGQGAVYEATDTRDGRKVALKVLAADAGMSERRLVRLRREAEAIGRVDHPGICRIHEAGLDGDVPYLALHLVPGRTLADAIGRARRRHPEALATIDAAAALAIPADDASAAGATTGPAWPRVVRFFEDAARAVHAAHEAGLVHRDVKPGNLMITPAGAPVVLDFGLARDEEEGRTITMTGALLGTPAYMAPEQIASGRGRLDRRVDVYSLGVSLFELLTLLHPFEAPTIEATVRSGLVGDAKELRQLDPRFPRDLALIVATAMRRDRDRRYVTALALAEDLRAFRLGRRIAARPPGVARALRDWAGLHPATASASAVAAVSLVAGLAISLHLLSETRTALQEATEAKRSARAAHDGSLELVRFMIGDLTKQLASVGRTDLLKTVAAKAAAHFATVGLDGLSDDGLATMADAWFTLGRAYELQGLRAEQIECRDKAFAIRERLHAAAPSDPKRAVDFAQSLCALARRRQSSGSLEEAMATFRRADELYSGTGGTQAYDVAAHHEHLLALLACGKLEWRLARPESTDTLRRARTTGDELVAKVPNDANVRVESESAAYELAVVLVEEGRLTAATEVAAEAVRRARAFAADHPDQPFARASLADSLWRMSDFALDRGDSAAARAAAAESRDIYVELHAMDATFVRWSNFNVLAHTRLVRALLACEHVVEALQVARTTRSLVEVTRKAPAVATDPSAMTEIASVLRTYGAALRRSGALDEAMQALNEAAKLLDQAVAIAPNESYACLGVVSHREELAACLCDSAAARPATAESQAARALATLEEADAVASRGAAARPVSATFERKRAFIRRETARVRRLVGDDAGAVAALEDAIRIRDRLAERDPAFVARLADLDALLADARGAAGTK